MSNGYKSSEFLLVLIAVVVWSLQSLGLDAGLLVELIGKANSATGDLSAVAHHGRESVDLPGMILAALYYAGQKYSKHRAPQDHGRNAETKDGGDHDNP